MNRALMILVFSAILLMEGILSQAITGTALHQTLLLAAAGLFLMVQWIGARVSQIAGVVMALALVAMGWYLLEKGWVPVVLSELPLPFHLAIGIHFWGWTRLVGRDRKAQAPVETWLAVIAGGLVVWTLGNVDVYGSDRLVMRGLAIAILAGSLLLAWKNPVRQSDVRFLRMTRRGGAGNGRRIQWWRGAGMGMLALALIAAGAWSLTLGEKAAFYCYQWWGTGEDFTDLGSFGTDQPVVTSSGGTLDGAMHQLPRRADLQLDDRVRFRLLFEDAESFARATSDILYLRTSTLASFSADGLIGPIREGRWIYDSDDGIEDGVTQLGDGENESPVQSFAFWTLIEKEDARALPLMPNTREIGMSGVYAFADDWFQLALEEDQQRVRFHSRAEPLKWPALTDDTTIEKGEAGAEYLQLPASALTDRVLQVVRNEMAGQPLLRDRLKALGGFLGRNSAYSLQYDNPGDLDPIENFLFGERRGHCELYAASTVMLLRGMGIPSRIAFGYSGGQSDSQRGLIAFRQSDYHAWAEIQLKDYGWVVFDTTPDGMGAASTAAEEPASAAFMAFDPENYEDLGAERLLGQIEVSRLTIWLTGTIDWVARFFPVMCGLVGLGALIYGRIRMKRRNRRRNVHEGREDVAVAMNSPSRRPGLLSAYLKRCGEIGFVKAPGQTLSEFLAEMKEAGACDDRFDSLNRYLYQLLYTNRSIDPKKEQEFHGILPSLGDGKGKTEE